MPDSRYTNQPSGHGDAPRTARARSVRFARPFRTAVFFTSIFFLVFIGTSAALVAFFIQPSQLAARLLVGGIALSVLTWVIAYFKRRAVYCPLCKGTPLVNSGARPHVRARRFGPFSHGISAVMSILATQKFRCMYCASDYDLLKPPSRMLQARGEEEID
jgi:hypothetical protein